MKLPLYSGPLDPVQELGHAVLLSDVTGIRVGPLQVANFERIPQLGRRGFLPIYLPTGAALAGYSAYGGEASGALNAGSSIPVTALKALTLNPGQLLQVRLLLRFVGTFPTGLSADDFDLQVNYPQTTTHWQLPNAGGVINAAGQFPMAADANVGSIQGTNQPLPGAYPATVDPITAAYQTEFFIVGQTPPAFTLFNNGSVAVGATAAFMVGLNISAISYKLMAWPEALAPQATRTFVLGTGKPFSAPPDSVIVPVAAFPPESVNGIV